MATSTRGKKRKKRPPDIFIPRHSRKHKQLEKLIHELKHEDPFWLIKILGNELVDLVFDVTDEGKRGGAA